MIIQKNKPKGNDRMKKIAFLLAVIILSMTVISSCSGTKYETVMEYKGIELKENMYYYWLSTFKRNILSSYSDAYDTEAFWSSDYNDEMTIEEYFTEIINDRIMNYLIAQSLYRTNGLKLSSDVKGDIKADIKEKIDYYGSRGALNAELKNLMLDIGSLEDVYTWEEKHEAVRDHYFGDGGIEEPSADAVNEYYQREYSRIKYIVFYTTKIKTDSEGNYVTDSNGSPVVEEMTKEELDAKLKKIDECYAKLESGASFDDVRKEYSEYDTSSYPNGFFVSSNELQTWGPDIILGAGKAEAGDFFKVEEESAVFIVLKCELTKLEDLSETDIEQLAKLNVYATEEIYDKKFGELQKDVKIFSEILGKYKLSEVEANPYYSF